MKGRLEREFRAARVDARDDVEHLLVKKPRHLGVGPIAGQEVPDRVKGGCAGGVFFCMDLRVDIEPGPFRAWPCCRVGDLDRPDLPPAKRPGNPLVPFRDDNSKTLPKVLISLLLGPV